jgi:hypothetical protein
MPHFTPSFICSKPAEYTEYSEIFELGEEKKKYVVFLRET